MVHSQSPALQRNLAAFTTEEADVSTATMAHTDFTMLRPQVPVFTDARSLNPSQLPFSTPTRT